MQISKEKPPYEGRLGWRTVGLWWYSGQMNFVQRAKKLVSTPLTRRVMAMYRIQATKLGSDNFASGAPSRQNIADLFRGEWSSSLPGLNAEPGRASLFEDPRIAWLNNVFDLTAKTVLELGPLEGAHTKMMLDFGAASVTAIEGNQRAFLKCLCVKELYQMQRSHFLLGDFIDYLAGSGNKFDVAVASGVLYHSTKPLDLLSGLVSASDRIFIWTHYFDDKIIRDRLDKHLFGDPKLSDCGNFTLVDKQYAGQSIGWKGFSGGPDRAAVWLTRESLLAFFHNLGFRVELSFDDPSHQNGPAIALCASKIR